MKSFNFKSAANTKEATKLVSGRATFLAGGMTLLPAIKNTQGIFKGIASFNGLNGTLLAKK